MYQYCTGPAHFPAFPVNAESYTLTNGQLALAAMTCASVLFVDTAYTASRTNADLLAIWNDPLFIPCYQVNSNAAGSVWCRPLTNNDLAVMLLIPSTAGPVTVGFSAQDARRPRTARRFATYLPSSSIPPGQEWRTVRAHGHLQWLL
jgi:hypothetical protein